MKFLIIGALVAMTAIAGQAQADSLNWSSAGKRLTGSPVGNPLSAEVQEMARRNELLRKGESLGDTTIVNNTSTTTAGCIIYDTTSSVYDNVSGSPKSSISKSNKCNVSGNVGSSLSK